MKDLNHNLKHLTKCPVCGTYYEQSQLRILKEDSVKTVFHTTCLKCGTAMMVFVSRGEQGIASMSMATDLNIQEALNLFEKRSISADNILDIYKELNK